MTLPPPPSNQFLLDHIEQLYASRSQQLETHLSDLVTSMEERLTAKIAEMESRVVKRIAELVPKQMERVSIKRNNLLLAADWGSHRVCLNDGLEALPTETKALRIESLSEEELDMWCDYYTLKGRDTTEKREDLKNYLEGR